MGTNTPFDILVSTTRQWNPGDEFIDMGCRRVIMPFIPSRVNWQLWDRNPDLSIHPTLDWKFRENLFSNSASNRKFKLPDAVLFSGSPEWMGPRTESIFAMIHGQPSRPLLFLGVGSAEPLPKLSERDKQVLKRPQSLIITRSTVLANQLNTELGDSCACALPCPALFASAGFDKAVSPSQKFAIIVQTPNTPGQDVADEYLAKILKQFECDWCEVDIICFHQAEYEYLSERLPCVSIRYSHNSNDYLDILSQYTAVASTRLHGAILCLSLGVSCAIIDRNDFRIESTRLLFDPLIQKVDPGEVKSWFEQNKSHVSVEAILFFKHYVWDEYHRRLLRFFKDNDLAFNMHGIHCS